MKRFHFLFAFLIFISISVNAYGQNNQLNESSQCYVQSNAIYQKNDILKKYYTKKNEPSQTIVITGYKPEKKISLINADEASPATVVITWPVSTPPHARKCYHCYYPTPDKPSDDYSDSNPQKVFIRPESITTINVNNSSYWTLKKIYSTELYKPNIGFNVNFSSNFHYNYNTPTRSINPISTQVDLAKTPWNKNTYLVQIGTEGYRDKNITQTPTNYIFLIQIIHDDNPNEKLVIAKEIIKYASENMGNNDTISIILYAQKPVFIIKETKDALSIEKSLECIPELNKKGFFRDSKDYIISKFVKNYKGINKIIYISDGQHHYASVARQALEKDARRMKASVAHFEIGANINSIADARMAMQEVINESSPVIAKNVKIKVEFNPKVVSEYRLIGYTLNAPLSKYDRTSPRSDLKSGQQVTTLYEVVLVGDQNWLPDQSKPKKTSNQIIFSDTEAIRVTHIYTPVGKSRQESIATTISNTQFQEAKAPEGDFAFAAAVAAFGQWLNEDKYLNGFNLVEIRNLAGYQTDPARKEFIKLIKKAETKVPNPY